MKNKLKILICFLILLVGIGAVSAIDSNSTADVISADDTQDLALDEEEVLAVSEENDIAEVSEDEVLGAAEDEVVAVSDDDSVGVIEEDVVSAEEDSSEVLAMNAAENEELSMSSSYYDDDYYDDYDDYDDLQVGTEYKTFKLGKLKLPKKYWAFDDGYKPPKSYKKEWKQYKKYKKYVKKQTKKFKKKAKKIVKKAKRKGWVFYGDVYYVTKYAKRYTAYTFKADAYREYYY